MTAKSRCLVVSIGPSSIEPLVRLLGHILPRGSLAFPLGDVVAGQVVERVCFVWAGAHVDGRLEEEVSILPEHVDG